MSDLLNLISARHSVRKYTEEQIPDETLHKILEAGRLAPSWMNVQCWKFILIKSEENKELLCKLSLSQPQVKNASALIVCVADKKAWEEANITNIQNPALNPALQNPNGVLVKSLEQIVYPISYMMLEAAALGVSSCIIGAMGNELTGVLDDVYKDVKSKLNLNEEMIISTIITLGYDAEPKDVQKVRKPFEEVVHSERIGNPFKF